MPNRQENCAGVITADGHARVQIGDSHNHTVVNNYLNSNPKLADSYDGDTDDEQVRTAFLLRLNTSPYEDRKNRKPNRVEGTCEWFTTHDLFRSWQEEKSAMLWVSADPGCGKSVLAKYLVDEVMASGTTRTTCFFFFKDDFDDQKTLEGALCCILHQLFVQKPDLLLHKFLDSFDEEGEQLFSSFDELWRMLIEATGHHNQGEIICILDALDECVENKRLAAALTQFYNNDKMVSPLKFLVTSRPYLYIGRELKALEDSQPTIHLSGESPEEVDKISQEINLVIGQRIKELGEMLRLPMEELQGLHAEITAINHRTYLWVHLTFSTLEETVFLSRAELRAKIHELPHTVEEAYDGILRKTCDPDKARKILHIIVAADRPLSLKEMAAALAFRGESHQCHQDLERDLTSPESLHIAIREACGLFVVIQASEVFLIHQTAKEFLVCLPPVRATTCSPLKWQYSLDPEESHHLLSEICIKYLLLADFERPTTVESSRAIGDERQFSFLEYAACNWAYHFRQTRNSGANLEHLALKLCDVRSPSCLHWLGVYGEKRMDKWISLELSTSLLISSYFGLDKLVASILRNSKTDVAVKGTSYHRTALSWASEKGYLAIVDLLLKHVNRFQVFFTDWSASHTSIVNRTDRFGRTPLWFAAANGHLDIVQALLRKGAKVDVRDQHGFTALSWATQHGYSDIVALLLENGAQQKSKSSQMDSRYLDGSTPLIKAARDGDEIVLKMLLNGGAKPGTQDFNGRTALVHASERGFDSVVKLLLDRGADVDATTALLYAAAHGHDRVVKLLLDQDADVGHSDADGCTALFLASSCGHYATAKLLIDRGANIETTNKHGFTSLTAAASGGHDTVVKLLMKREARIINSEGNSALSHAAHRGHLATVRLILEQGAGIVTMDELGISLAFACDEGHADVVELFLDRGVSVNRQDRDKGRTGLSLASSNGRVAVVKLLLDRGASIQAEDNNGARALMYASVGGHIPVMEMLLDRYWWTDINAQDNDGWTALIYGAWKGRIAVVELLLDRGAGMDVRDHDGWTALILALAMLPEAPDEDVDKQHQFDRWGLRITPRPSFDYPTSKFRTLLVGYFWLSSAPRLAYPYSDRIIPPITWSNDHLRMSLEPMQQYSLLQQFVVLAILTNIVISFQ
ncbi:ankyrin repeat-containing domain protein [Apiospora hydei]|uniref:Ankyrin repeat-containing domain protein n=1 Tax=Apiospora hydei TaxID=1337664 RepID=A0ABR1UVD5_9PEZI